MIHRLALLICLTLLCSFSPVMAKPHPKPQAAPHTVKSHALAKVSRVTLGSVLFAVENVVDGVHLVTSTADKALLAIQPVLYPVEKVVHVANTLAADVDTGLEVEEQKLFGTSN